MAVAVGKFTKLILCFCLLRAVVPTNLITGSAAGLWDSRAADLKVKILID